MSVHPAAADLVPARLREIALAETGKKRTSNHDGTAQRSAFLHELGGSHVAAVDLIGLEGVFALGMALNLDTHALEQFDEVAHVQDFRDVADAHRLSGEEDGAENLQGLVLCSLRGDCATQFVAAFDDE